MPTWNYSAVQVRGRLAHARDAAENRRVLERTVEHFEARLGTGWRLSGISAAVVEMYARGTASFSVAIDRMDAAHKMSQDKLREDVTAVIAGLSATEDEQARAVADVMTSVTLVPGRHR